MSGDSPAASKDSPVFILRNSQVRLAPSGAPGFNGRAARAVPSRLIDAVAGTLVVGSVSLGLAVAITLLSIRISTAMPG
jgi:hypothetical protein